MGAARLEFRSHGSGGDRRGGALVPAARGGVSALLSALPAQSRAATAPRARALRDLNPVHTAAETTCAAAPWCRPPEGACQLCSSRRPCPSAPSRLPQGRAGPPALPLAAADAPVAHGPARRRDRGRPKTAARSNTAPVGREARRTAAPPAQSNAADASRARALRGLNPVRTAAEASARRLPGAGHPRGRVSFAPRDAHDRRRQVAWPKAARARQPCPSRRRMTQLRMDPPTPGSGPSQDSGKPLPLRALPPAQGRAAALMSAPRGSGCG